MAFSEKFLEELAERNEITDVVSQYVRLTEKNRGEPIRPLPLSQREDAVLLRIPGQTDIPLLRLRPGGGVIGFIMEIENLSFRDAVAFLAQRAGMPLPEEEKTEEASQRRRLLELNREAARFFHSRLMDPEEGAPARDYVAPGGASPGQWSGPLAWAMPRTAGPPWPTP